MESTEKDFTIPFPSDLRRLDIHYLYGLLDSPHWEGPWCTCSKRKARHYYRISITKPDRYDTVWDSQWCESCQYRIKTSLVPFNKLTPLQCESVLFLYGYAWAHDAAIDHHDHARSLYQLVDEIQFPKVSQPLNVA